MDNWKLKLNTKYIKKNLTDISALCVFFNFYNTDATAGAGARI